MKKQSIHYKNALSLIKNNNVSGAVKELKLSLKFHKLDTDSLNLLGLAFYLKCRFQKAEEKWRKSLEIKRKNNKAADYLELITKNDFKELRKEYQKIIFNDKVKKNKKTDFLKKVIAEHEELIEPYVLLGLLYKKEENYEEALKYFYKAYDLDKGNQTIKNYILDCEEKSEDKNYFDLNFLSKKSSIAAASIFFTIISLLILINFSNVNSFQDNTSHTHASSNPGIDSAATSGPANNSGGVADQDFSNTKRQKNNNTFLNLKNNSPEDGRTSSSFSEVKALSSHEETFSSDSINYVIEDLQLSFKQLQNILSEEKKKEELQKYASYIEEGSEQRLFDLALSNFRSGNYEEASKMFASIYTYSEVDYLKKESLYLLSRSSEKSEQYEQAEFYYRRYLNEYKDSNYYDEALYNLGLMYHKINKINLSREILNKLREEKPYSQYNNSKVYNILNGEGAI